MSFDEANFPDLPGTWTHVVFGDASEVVPVKNKIQTKNYLQNGDLAVVDQGSVLVGGYTNDASLAVATDLPVVVFGDHTRAIKYIDFPFAAGADGIKVLRPTKCFLPRLFFRFMQTLRLPNRGYARHFQHLRSSCIPVPPLSEQSRIADKLDAVLARVDACRDRLDRVPAILKRFRQSVLAAATSGELTTDWRAEQVARMEPQADPGDAVHEAAGRLDAVHGNPDSAALHLGYPAVWSISSVDEVASVIFDGPFGSNLKSNDYAESGVRVVRLENIGWLQFLEEKRTYVSLDKHQTLQRHTLRGEDILFSSFISEQVRVCLLPNQFSGNAINKADCLCIRVNQRICLPKFLAMRLACPSTFLALERQIHGATRPRVNLAQLRQLQFNLPSTHEQNEIVRRVETLFAYADRLEARYATARAQVERLTPALLAKAFRGELVPQDPDDEPASVLLDRIRAARAAAPAKPRRGRQRPASGRKEKGDPRQGDRPHWQHREAGAWQRRGKMTTGHAALDRSVLSDVNPAF